MAEPERSPNARSRYGLRTRGARPAWAVLAGSPGAGRGKVPALDLSEPHVAAALSAGLHPERLNDAEEAHFGDQPKAYLKLRNAMLAQWLAEPNKYVTMDAFAEGKRPGLAKRAHLFLEKWGHINFGVVGGEKAPASQGLVRKGKAGDGAEESSQEMTIKRALYEVLATVDLEETSMKMVRAAVDKKLGFKVEKAMIIQLVDEYMEAQSAGGGKPPALDGTAPAEEEAGLHDILAGSTLAGKRVIVVGAGPAGLSAARHLTRLGVGSVTVLEARERIGGRVHSYTDAGFSCPVDLGASIITGTALELDASGEGGRRPDPSTLLARQLGISLHPLAGACPIHDGESGAQVSGKADERAEKLWDSLLDATVAKVAKAQVMEGEEAGSLAGVSLGAALDEALAAKRCDGGDVAADAESERLLSWHYANLEYGCSAPLSDVSLLHWNQDEQYGGFGGGHAMVKGGYSQILEGLARGLDIRKGCPVAEIRHGGDGVTVVTAGGEEVAGDAVLVTAPLGVLKAGSIAFSPPLPDWKTDAVGRLGFGDLNKVILEFDEAFWNPELDFFGAAVGGCTPGEDPSAVRGRCFMFWNLHRFSGAPVVGTLLSGASARAAEGESDAALQAAAMALLERIHPDADVPKPRACHVSRWGSEPFTRGSYSFVAVGATAEDYDALARPVGERLLFAGEHTCKEHPDTVGGALLTGLREAVRLLHTLCGQSFRPVPIKEAVVVHEEDSDVEVGSSDDEGDGVMGDGDGSESEYEAGGSGREDDEEGGRRKGRRTVKRKRTAVMGDEGGSEEEDSGTESDEGLPRKGGRRGRKRQRGSEGEDGEGEGEGGAGIWGYIRQAGIIDAEMLKEWDVLDLKEAAAREAVRAEAAKVKAGRKARKAGGEEKRPKEKKGGRRRGGTDGGSDGEEGGLRRLEYRDPVRAAEVERARREALNSLKELFRTVKCAAEGDIAPIRAAIGSSPDGSTLAALLKELCGFNTALSAVAADAGCMGEVHRHAAAAGSAGLLLPEVVRMLGLLPATGSTADCVRASGLLKLLQEYSSGSKEVEGAPVGQAVRASIARVLARWAPTKEAARAHKPIKIMTTHAAFAAGGLKRVEAVKRAPAPAPSPPPAKPRAPTTGTTTNGSTPGHTAGGSAPPTDAAPTDDGGDDDPVISSALEAAKRANEAAKEAAAAAAEADQEATTSSVDFLHIGTFSYGDEEKVTASGKGRDGGIASNGRERSHSGKKVSGRGNTEDKKAGSGGKDSVRSLARRLKEERAARKATASDKTKLRVPSGSASKSHTASGKEKKGEKDEWSFEADLKKHISNLLAPLHVNKRINKEGFHEIRNSSMRKVLEKTRIKTKKESMEYLSNEKNKQRIETLVNGYAKHYKTKLDQGGAKRTQAALPNAP